MLQRHLISLSFNCKDGDGHFILPLPICVHLHLRISILVLADTDVKDIRHGIIKNATRPNITVSIDNEATFTPADTNKVSRCLIYDLYSTTCTLNHRRLTNKQCTRYVFLASFFLYNKIIIIKHQKHFKNKFTFLGHQLKNRCTSHTSNLNI